MTEEITAGVAFPVRYGRCVSRFSKRAAVSACLRRARLSERGVAVGHFTGETLSRAEAMRRRTVDSSKSTLVFRNAWRLGDARPGCGSTAAAATRFPPAWSLCAWTAGGAHHSASGGW